MIASISEGTTLQLDDGSGVVREGANKFHFDRVFDWETSQAQVYKDTAEPLVKDVFQGYNTVRMMNCLALACKRSVHGL